MLELKLQAEDSFVLKVVQLEELLQVRHSVFVIGNAGCGKSQVAAEHSQGGWELGEGCRAPQELPPPLQQSHPIGAEVAQQDVPQHEAQAGHCGPRPKGCDLR